MEREQLHILSASVWITSRLLLKFALLDPRTAHAKYLQHAASSEIRRVFMQERKSLPAQFCSSRAVEEAYC